MTLPGGADLVLGGVGARCFLCPELGGNHNLVAQWLEGFADQRFVLPIRDFMIAHERERRIGSFATAGSATR